MSKRESSQACALVPKWNATTIVTDFLFLFFFNIFCNYFFQTVSDNIATVANDFAFYFLLLLFFSLIGRTVGRLPRLVCPFMFSEREADFTRYYCSYITRNVRTTQRYKHRTDILLSLTLPPHPHSICCHRSISRCVIQHCVAPSRRISLVAVAYGHICSQCGPYTALHDVLYLQLS